LSKAIACSEVRYFPFVRHFIHLAGRGDAACAVSLA
jgi:hypothetical protein